MEESMSFAPLLLVLLLAFLVPILLSRFKKLRIPIVVGEIIAGIIVGRSGFNWVNHHDPVLELLAEFGFVFLMFLSGMEIDFSVIGSTPKSDKNGSTPRVISPLKLGSLVFVVSLALSIAIGFGLYSWGYVEEPWLISLILATISLGVIVPVLKEGGMSSTRYGQTILIISLVADFVTMLLITVVVAALSKGLTLDILLVTLLFIAFFLFYRFGTFFFDRVPVVRRVLEDLSSATAQIKLRAAFTLMLIFVVLSEVVGTEVILGAFLAGAIIALLRRPEDTELVHQLEAMGYGFFIPIFFIMVGVTLNFSALFQSPDALILVPLLVIAAFLVKILPGLLMRLAFTWRETIGGGVLLSAQLSLTVAAAAIGMQLGIINESVNAAIIVMAVVTVTIAPLLFNRIVPPVPAEKRRPFVVIGAGPMGLQVAEQLRGHKDDVVLLDMRPDRVERAKERGFVAVEAYCDRHDERAEAFLNNARAVLCVYGDVDVNFRTCQHLRQTYGIEHIVARVNTPSDVPRFEQIGVKTMNPAMDQATLLVLLARNPALYELLTRTDDDKEVCEVMVRNRYVVGKAIRELDISEDVLVLAIRRNGELIVPHGNTRLEEGDQITLLGPQDCAEQAVSLVRQA